MTVFHVIARNTDPRSGLLFESCKRSDTILAAFSVLRTTTVLLLTFNVHRPAFQPRPYPFLLRCSLVHSSTNCHSEAVVGSFSTTSVAQVLFRDRYRPRIGLLFFHGNRFVQHSPIPLSRLGMRLVERHACRCAFSPTSRAHCSTASHGSGGNCRGWFHGLHHSGLCRTAYSYMTSSFPLLYTCTISSFHLLVPANLLIGTFVTTSST